VPSSFTLNKSIEKPAAGSYNSTWSTPVNADWDDIDNAFGGSTTISLTGVTPAQYALTLAQYQPPNIIFTGTVTGNFIWFLPAGVGGMWSIFNNTSGSFYVAFGSGPTGLAAYAVPQGERAFLVCDGANMQLASTPILPAAPSVKVGLTAVTGTADSYMTSDSAPALDQSIAPTWTGAHVFQSTVEFVQAVKIDNTVTMNGGSILDGTSATIKVQTQSTGDNSTLAASTAFVKALAYAPLASPAFSGVPTAPTAAPGTNTTQVATTAFVETLVLPGASLAANGYRKNPDGSIDQWGVSAASGTFATVTFPIAFPNACFSIVASPLAQTSTYFLSAPSASASSFTINIGASGTQFAWRAIGN
jgi:hypothetical protein